MPVLVRMENNAFVTRPATMGTAAIFTGNICFAAVSTIPVTHEDSTQTENLLIYGRMKLMCYADGEGEGDNQNVTPSFVVVFI